MKATSKPTQAGPASSGPRDSKKKKATSNTGTSGARECGKPDSANVHDSRRDNQPKAWARKTKGHRDQAQAVREGGSVN